MSKSLTTTDEERLPLIHPGEILREEFLEPFQLSAPRVAKDLGVAPRRINDIIRGTRAITADTALRLGVYFGTSPQFWMNLQSGYDLRRAERERGAAIEAEVRPFR